MGNACASAGHERKEVDVGKRQRRSNDLRARVAGREPAELRKLSRALIALAMAQAQAEAKAEADHKKRVKEGKPRAA